MCGTKAVRTTLLFQKTIFKHTLGKGRKRCYFILQHKENMYNGKDLVRIAKRENNNKRKYLVVNRLQGKHIPVKPQEALQMFWELGNLIRDRYAGERLLLVGFAETATAIGAAVACQLQAYYIQTTRESVSDVSYLFFSEDHSHATEQKLVKEDIDAVMGIIDRIVFIEDEVTTGNTIMNIVTLLQEKYLQNVAFSVASLLNGMNEANQNRYKEHGIEALFLVRTNHKAFEGIAELASGDGRYVKPDINDSPQPYKKVECTDYLDARRLVAGKAYQKACDKLWEQIWENVDFGQSSNVLVLGTEEFMFPALYTAYRLMEQGKDVRFHATTRSPIAVSMEPDYPLHTRYELVSVYDAKRTTFVYGLDTYDQVLIITDEKSGEGPGINSAVNALSENGNNNIIYIRWKDDRKK